MNKSASYIVTDIVFHILDNLCQKIDQSQLIKAKLNKYCSNKVIFTMNQLGDQILSNPQTFTSLEEGEESKNMQYDSLMTVNVIEEKQLFDQTSPLAQKNIKNIPKKRQNSHSNSSRNKNKQQIIKPNQKVQSHFHKLKDHSEEDQSIQIIRKQSLKRYEEEEKKNSQHLKEIVQNRGSDINFDYDGKIIAKKKEKKRNLVSKGLKGNIPEEVIHKNPFSFEEKVQEITSKMTIREEDSLKKINKSKRKKVNEEVKKVTQQIEFSNIKQAIPMSNFDCKNGVKVKNGKSVIEKKQKQLSVKELRRTITSRKLSRSEYRKLKSNPKKGQSSVNSGITPVPTFQLLIDKLKVTQNKRSITQAGERNEKININSEELKKVLIKKIPTPQMTSHEVPHFQSPTQKPEELNRIDKYNLNYAQNKINHQSQRPLTKQSIQFPKVSHIQTKSVFYPKNRERMGNPKTLQEIRKKFQQNLRT